MQFHRSAHAGSLRPTAANKILDMGADPAIISLAAGNPAPEAYPIAAVQDITRRILEEEPLEALQYSVPQGDPSLRRAVTDWMRSHPFPLHHSQLPESHRHHHVDGKAPPGL